jgi:hypothetical protein
MVEIPEAIRGCVSFAFCACVGLPVQSVEQDALCRSRLSFDREGEFQDLDGYVP